MKYAFANSSKILLVIIFFANIFAQENPTWVTYAPTWGIPSIAAQDDYVWIATAGTGILKVNTQTGNKVSFNRANSGLPSDDISSIAIDDNGKKWIGTHQGLTVFDDTTWTIYTRTNSGLPAQGVGTIAIDNSGCKWMATSGGGVAKFDDTTWTVYNVSNSGLLSDFYNSSIAIDNNDNKWFGGNHPNGLAKFDGTYWTVYNVSNSGLPANHISSIATDENGIKWIGTHSGGLAKFDDTNWTVYDTLNSSIPSNYVSSIVIDDNGIKWIATSGGAIASFDDATWTVYNSSNSEMPNYWIESIAIDANGDKWIGWNSRLEWMPPQNPSVGLTKFDSTTWYHYEVSNGILFNGITSIAIDAHGIKWIGWGQDDPDMGESLGGLTEFDGSSWIGFNGYNVDLLNNVQTIKSIAIDENDVKWIGTHRRGLLKFDGTSWTIFDTSNSGLPVIWDISSIAIDHNGAKWIGGSENGGLTRFDDTTWTVYTVENSDLPGNWIRSIVIDNYGNKWVGTDNGLARFDGMAWTVFNTANSGLVSDNVNTVAIDNESNIWVGTHYDLPNWRSNLIKFDGTNWTEYDLSSPALPESYDFTSIVIDDERNKWIGLRWGGLIKFDETSVTLFNMANSGLPGNQILALTIDENGNKWIGTDQGLAVFNEGGTVPVGIDDILSNSGLASDFKLNQNYPNPFNPITTISYSVLEQTVVKLTVFDIRGRKIKSLQDASQSPGNYEVQWNGLNNNGNSVSTGVYFCRLDAESYSQTIKMVYLR